MTFAWIDFLELAEFLANSQGSFSDEAGKRSAISRAYYAAYCHARNYAVNVLGVDFEKDKSARNVDIHVKVRQCYLNHADENLNEIGNLLQVARDRRNNSDYDEKFEHISEVQATIEDAGAKV